MLKDEGCNHLFSQYSSSPKNSLRHIIDASPFNSRYQNFGHAFISNINKVEVSAQISQGSDLIKGVEMQFIDRVPGVPNDKSLLFFKSSQLNRVNQSNNMSMQIPKSKLYMSQIIRQPEGLAQPQIAKEQSIHTSSIITDSSIKKDASTRNGENN